MERERLLDLGEGILLAPGEVDIPPVGCEGVQAAQLVHGSVRYAGCIAALSMKPMSPPVAETPLSTAYDVLLIGAGCSTAHPSLSGAHVTMNDFTSDGNHDDIPSGLGTFVAGLVVAQEGPCPGYAPSARLLVNKVITSSGILSDKALTDGLRAATQLKVPVVCLAFELDDCLRELPSLSLQFLLEQLARTADRLVVVSSSLGRHLTDLVRDDELLSVIGYDSTSSSLSIGPQLSAIRRQCNALVPAEAVWSLHHRKVAEREGKEEEWGYRKMSGNVVGAALLASLATRFVLEHRVGSNAYTMEDGFKRDFLGVLEAGILHAHRKEELHRCVPQSSELCGERVCPIAAQASSRSSCRAHRFRRQGQPFILDWLLEYGTTIGEQVLSLSWRGLSIEVIDKKMSLHDAGLLLQGALAGIGVEFPRHLLPPIVQSHAKEGRFEVPFSQLFTKAVDVWEIVYWLESRTDVILHAELQSETLSPHLPPPEEAPGTMVSDYFASNLPRQCLRGSGVRVAVIGDGDCHRLDPMLRFDLGMDILHCSKWSSLDEFSRACCLHETCPTPDGDGGDLQPTAFEIIQEVTPEAELVPIRCSPPTPGRAVGDLATGPLVLAIEHALSVDCEVLLLDVRGMGGRHVERAIHEAVKKGVIVIAPAGDAPPSEGIGAKRVLWPARYSDVIAVGGCTEDGSPWDGSCRGPQVDICAMAHAVQVQQLPGQLSSTCAAAAIVAGVAAAWIEHAGRAALQELEGTAMTRATAFQCVLSRLRVVRPAWSRVDERDLCGLLDQTALEILETLPSPSLEELHMFLASPDGARIRAPQLAPCFGLDLMRLPSTFRQELCTIAVVTTSTVISRTPSPKGLLSKFTTKLSRTGHELLLQAMADQRIAPEHMSRTLVEPVTGLTFAVVSRHVMGIERRVDVTVAANVPAALAHSSLSVHDERVFFTAGNGCVYELFLRFGKWHHTNISLLFPGRRARSLVGPSSVLQWHGKEALRWVFFVSSDDRRIRFFHHNNHKKAKSGEPDTLGWQMRTPENVPRVHPDCTWLSSPTLPGECISFVAEHTGEVHHLCLQVTKCTCPAFARMSDGGSISSSSDSLLQRKGNSLTASGGSDKRASSGSFNLVTPVIHHTISDENLGAIERELREIAPWIVSSRKLKDALYDDDVEDVTIDATVDEFLAEDSAGASEAPERYREGFFTGLFLSLPYSFSADAPPSFENTAFRRGFRAAAASLADETERRARVEYQLYAKYSHELQWGDLIQISTTSDQWITARRKKKDFHVARHHPDLFPFAKACQKVFQVHFTDVPGWIMLKAYDGTWVRLDGTKLLADARKIDQAARFHVVGLSREDEQGGLWSWAPGSAHIQCMREGTPTYMRAQFRSVRVDRSKPKGCETYRIFIRHRLAWSD